MSRYQAVSWTDRSGNFWLFGGINAYEYIVNDLLEYDPTAKSWTWWGGSPTEEKEGIYGTKGVAAASNFPGSRDSAISWTDSGGNLWLFGGDGIDSNDMLGDLNDLWEFSTATEEWMWVGGSSTEGARGVYGTLGVASASNVPGARYSAVSWTDGSGNLWLFGGEGLDSTGAAGNLNDLWEFNPTTKEWAWMSGSDTANASGVYGSLGVPAVANVPLGRVEAVSWSDGSGNLWLFGGAYNGGADLNDLWRYQP
jgi:N-acetylneuraminic acid mutarotase